MKGWWGEEEERGWTYIQTPDSDGVVIGCRDEESGLSGMVVQRRHCLGVTTEGMDEFPVGSQLPNKDVAEVGGSDEVPELI